MSNMTEFEYTQGLADGHWYYAPVGNTDIDKWVGPFMTKTCAIEHSTKGTFHVID
jgi:hypothetical protein